MEQSEIFPGGAICVPRFSDLDWTQGGVSINSCQPQDLLLLCLATLGDTFVPFWWPWSGQVESTTNFVCDLHTITIVTFTATLRA